MSDYDPDGTRPFPWAKCPVCDCTVPRTHVPDSDDCHNAGRERLASITADHD